MKSINIQFILALTLLVGFVTPSKADVWGELAKGLLNGLNTAVQMSEKQIVQDVIDNPSKQSADMKKFLNQYRTANEYYSQGDLTTAWGCYYSAKQTAEHTSDRILQLAYQKYGLKSEIEGIMVVCWNSSGAATSVESDYNTGSSSYSSGGSYYNTGTTSTSSTCRKCHGKKICTTCNGTGTYFSTMYGLNKYITCPACNGKKVCSLCDGH